MGDTRYEVIVVGAGAMGSAAGWWLARRGRRVLVVDRFPAGHVRGSSHGSVRIFRLGYPQPEYTELVLAARELWRELEHASGTRLLDPVGTLDDGPPDKVDPVRRCLDRCGLRYEMFDPAEAARRWDGIRFSGEVLYQPDGGVIRADRTLRALHEQIRRHGGDLRLGVGRATIEPRDGGVRVHMEQFTADAPVAVIAAGPWAAETLDGAVALPPLTVTREQVCFFTPLRPEAQWPCFIRHDQPSMYGLAAPGQGFKLAEHHAGPVVTADGRSFEVDPAGRDRVTEFVRSWLPGLDPRPTAFETCLYTSTPDHNFVIDRQQNLVVAAGFSGHGFKFTPLVGRLLADLTEDSQAAPAMFRLSRTMPSTTTGTH